MKKLQLLLKSLALVFFFNLILLISAGDLDYWQGWLYISVNILMTLMTVLAAQYNTELISERMNPGKGIKSWDKVILAISTLCYVAMLIVAGLDSGHFNWSPEFHWSIYVTGIVLTITGQILFLVAKNQNKFFSSVVRIQTDRGHTVCETGLYKFVRHPGYFGMVISNVGFPFLLGSYWCTIPVVFSIALLLIRTSLEDKTLINELKGYYEYSLNTRSKIIPGIW
jgi:protein-S-isoprenylcysteine O-methyltransferase Ste14